MEEDRNAQMADELGSCGQLMSPNSYFCVRISHTPCTTMALSSTPELNGDANIRFH